MATVNIDATNYTLVANTGTICTKIATSSDTATLIITPTVPCRKVVVIITDTAGSQTVDVAKGAFWAGKAMTQVTLAANVPRAFVFESAKSMTWSLNNAADTYAYRIVLTFGTPAVTTGYQVLQLP